MAVRIQNIKGPSNWLSVVIDIGMLVLTSVDLVWLMFDALYTTQTVKTLVDPILPFYKAIHEDFYFYDGIIVSIFILEFIGRWGFSIYKKRHDKWFFYPFIHWYDVLGCFPTSSFRILRLFRIIGLTYRLHQWEVIDLSRYSVFQTLSHYYEIAIEEVSDRVVIKVLSEAKSEVQRGQPLSDAIAQKIIKPKQSELAAMIGKVIQDGLVEKYPEYRKLFQKHIVKTVRNTVKTNQEVQQLDRIPIIGQQIQSALHSATSQIVFGVLDQLIMDLGNPENQQVLPLLIESIMDILLQQRSLQNTALTNEIIVETIDLIVERVNVKQWKLKE